MKPTTHKCFNCGLPTEQTIQTRERKGRTYICSPSGEGAKCWNRYYKMADAEKKPKKPKS